MPDVIRFLLCNWPELEAAINDENYKVLVGNNEIDEKTFLDPIGSEDIRIIPVIKGSGGSTGKILAGAAMIGLAFATGGASFAWGAGFTFKSTALGGAWLAKGLVGAGAMLTLSGVSQALTPQTKIPDHSSPDAPRLSFSFSGIQNTSRAGTPVPICYGEIITGSVVISMGIDTEQVRK